MTIAAASFEDAGYFAAMAGPLTGALLLIAAMVILRAERRSVALGLVVVISAAVVLPASLAWWGEDCYDSSSVGDSCDGGYIGATPELSLIASALGTAALIGAVALVRR